MSYKCPWIASVITPSYFPLTQRLDLAFVKQKAKRKSHLCLGWSLLHTCSYVTTPDSLRPQIILLSLAPFYFMSILSTFYFLVFQTVKPGVKKKKNIVELSFTIYPHLWPRLPFFPAKHHPASLLLSISNAKILNYTLPNSCPDGHSWPPWHTQHSFTQTWNCRRTSLSKASLPTAPNYNSPIKAKGISNPL